MSALLVLLLAGASLAQHAPPQEFYQGDQQYYQPSSQHQGRNIDTGNIDNIDYSQYHSQPINFAPQEGWTHQVMELDNRDGHHYREQPLPVQGAGSSVLSSVGRWFRLSAPYVVGLTTTFAFVFGIILIFDLIFANANIIQRITGRDGRVLADMVQRLDVNDIMTAADEVYGAIEKFQRLDLPKK